MDDFPSKFPRTSAAIAAGMVEGLHAGAQIYISRARERLADTALGNARPGVPMAAETILLWLSSGKPIAAVALAKQWEAGLLDLDDPVGRFIPEFANRGKEGITVRHLLTHTSGIRGMNFTTDLPWDQIIARICSAAIEPRWIPGRSAGYHPFTSWFVLGEIIRRLDPGHRDYQTYVTQEIFRPLQMDDCYVSLTQSQFHALFPRIGQLEVTSASSLRPTRFDTDETCSIVAPGATARGPVRQLARFYEMLLNKGELDGVRLLAPQTVEALTARHRVGMLDLTFKQKVDWGLGFLSNSNQYDQHDLTYGYGPYAGPRTYGHSGSQSSTAFADPENGLVVALLFNGMPGESAHRQRMNSALRAIYEDLKLDSL
jgi:CubicO group peptidase (beta-lactamase class C family)